jgi:uncharacterized protein (DUF1800 family)
MGKFTRRDFLEALPGHRDKAMSGPDKDEAFEKYANHALPTGLAKTTAGLNAYSGPWTLAKARHLLRRTVFGLKPAEIDTLAGMNADSAVDLLLDNIPPLPEPPVNYYNTATYIDSTGVLLGETWVNAPIGDGDLAFKKIFGLKAWWINLLLKQNLSIEEKMVFFWHNHFSTEIEVVFHARVTYRHLDRIRKHALGNFKTLVREIATDPCMLIYLNGNLNVKDAPDENLGRELQELFTVGKYNNPNYNEDDVKAAARVLTGWKVDFEEAVSYFDPAEHDTSDKQFSSFYDNVIISGQSGASGVQEVDALVDMIFAKEETALYICRKLYRYFVYYVIDEDVEANVIRPMADILLANGYEIKPVLEALLKSEHFFDDNLTGCYIRTPLDLLIGTFRTFDIVIPPTISLLYNHKILNYIRAYAANAGVNIAGPPNVSGYPAYYQVPQYYEMWINSNTLPSRMAFTDMMLTGGFTAQTTETPEVEIIEIDVFRLTGLCTNPGNPEILLGFFLDLLMGLPVTESKKSSLKAILLSGQSSDYYWTQAWQNYIGSPDMINTEVVKSRLTSLLIEIMRLEEHQLC